MANNKPFRPDWISCPGDTIKDILEERKLSLSQFADLLGESIDTAQDLIQGRAPLNEKIAIQLSNVLGGSYDFWLAREWQYQKDLKHHELGEQFLSELPINDMLNFGWLPPISNRKDLLSKCLEFFELDNVWRWQKTYRDVIETAAFRTSPTFDSKTGSVAAWLRQGEIISKTIECKTWNKKKFIEALKSVRTLTRESDPEVFIPELSKICSECGVAVVILRAPTGCRASGATRILSTDKTMLLLSFRYLSDDHFWFTFFHEAGHIVLHRDKALFLDEPQMVYSKEEEEANDFAARTLIPKPEEDRFLNLDANARAVMRFARSIGISPGIVVGQLQHRGILRRNQLNNLKKQFSWNS